MQQSFKLSFFPFAAMLLLGSAAVTGGGIYLGSSSGQPAPERTLARWSNPSYVGGPINLTSGFKNWELCDLGGRIETLPPIFSMPKWGPAALPSASGCFTCSNDGSFSGNPKTAGLGFSLAPPNDFSSDVPQLPPHPNDHPFVMADTGEVVYSEVDFVIPGQGFDFVWYRTYRSAYEFEGWQGYGWSHGAELYLVEGANGNVGASLGNSRVGDVYTYDSLEDAYASPDGFWDNLTKGLRPANYVPAKYAGNSFFTKTEKNGVVWEFDYAEIGGSKPLYVCTSITDAWQNTFLLAYAANDPMRLIKVADAVGHEATFVYSVNPSTGQKDLITKVTVSNTEIDVAYGDVVIDYSYTEGILDRVDKMKTRNTDGGPVVRPYTEYKYGIGDFEKDLEEVYYSSTTDPYYQFEYTMYDGVSDRCTKVTGADGEVSSYVYDAALGSEFMTQYLNPSNQRRDFVYASSNGRVINRVREHLEDGTGAPISATADLVITRGCDCGQITKLEYTDGSAEEWEYDPSHGSVTKYTRIPTTGSNPNTNLVKKWTYITFGSPGVTRLQSSTGWLQMNSNPLVKVTYAWDSAGGLDTVTLPLVAIGVPSSQSIVYDYTIDAGGVLGSVIAPDGGKVKYEYNGLNLKTTVGADSVPLEAFETEVSNDEMGNIVAMQGRFGVASQWTYLVTPDGRVLSMLGPDGQEKKFEYDLSGKLLEFSVKLDGVSWTTTKLDSSAGGIETSVTRDFGGMGATSTEALEIAESQRFLQKQNPDGYGIRSQWGYGSYGQKWKSYDLDNSTGANSVALSYTLERDTMGRILKKTRDSGELIEYDYDIYGRLSSFSTSLPNGKKRITTYSYNPQGAIEKEEVSVDSVIYARFTSSYDEANRFVEGTQEDPTGVLPNRIVRIERDKNSRILKYTDVNGGVIQKAYRADGREKTSTDPIGNHAEFFYDDLNRIVIEKFSAKNTLDSTVTEYVTETTFLGSGEISKVVDKGSAQGNQTYSFEYFDSGARKSSTDPLGAKTEFAYNNLGFLLSEKKEIDDVSFALTAYEYSLAGLREKVIDANSRETTWTFDSLGRERTVTYPSGTGQTNVYTYNYGDNGLESITSPLGAVQTFIYDGGGRLVQVDLDKASSGLIGPDQLVFTYDAMDRILSGKTRLLTGSTYSDLTSVTRGYNGFGQLAFESQDGGHTINYVYSSGGALREIEYPAGGPVLGVKYTIDGLGRVEKVERSMSATLDVEGVNNADYEVAATLGYDGFREIERIQDGYDLKRTQSWDAFRRPGELQYLNNPTGSILSGYKYSLDNGGRMAVRERLQDFDGTYGWGEVYRRDRMGRVTKSWTNVRNPENYVGTDPAAASVYSTKVEWALGKTYERNMVKTTTNAGGVNEVAFSPNSAYQYSDIGAASLTWNANGQLIDWGDDSYSWTVLGQLAEVTIGQEPTQYYSYDAFGRRAHTIIDQTESVSLFHGWHLIGVFDESSSSWLWQEIPMPLGEGRFEHIALDTNDLDGDANLGEYRQYAVHEDWQNSILGLSDVSGEMVEQYVEDSPFGLSHTIDSAGLPIGDFASRVYQYKRLHGGIVDPVSHLYDFKNRWYSPISGSWLSRDPYGYQDSENLYQAFLANPLEETDQFGLSVGGGENMIFPCDTPGLDDALACCEMAKAAIASIPGLLGDALSGKTVAIPLVDLSCIAKCDVLMGDLRDCNYNAHYMYVDSNIDKDTWLMEPKDGTILKAALNYLSFIATLRSWETSTDSFLGVYYMRCEIDYPVWFKNYLTSLANMALQVGIIEDSCCSWDYLIFSSSKYGFGPGGPFRQGSGGVPIVPDGPGVGNIGQGNKASSGSTIWSAGQ